jgi:hypothetical protein
MRQRLADSLVKVHFESVVGVLPEAAHPCIFARIELSISLLQRTVRLAEPEMFEDFASADGVLGCNGDDVLPKSMISMRFARYLSTHPGRGRRVCTESLVGVAMGAHRL